MDKMSIVHDLTMKYLEKYDAATTGPADYAKVYLETFNSIDGYLQRHGFEAIGDAPDDWKIR